MKSISLCLLAAAALIPSVARCADPFTGRWDLVVTPKAAGAKIYPDWMEVGTKDGAPSVRIQPRSGSAFYAKQFKAQGTHLNVLWANDTTTWDLDVKDGKLTGVEKRGDNVFADLTGVRAPAAQTRLRPKPGPTPNPSSTARTSPAGSPPTRPRPITMWPKTAICSTNPKAPTSRPPASSTTSNCTSNTTAPTKATAASICAAATKSRSNTRRWTPTTSSTASAPSTACSRPPWSCRASPAPGRRFDITLVGRWLTVVRNGVKTIDNQEIAGITGGALDSNEGEPGPFYIQGDHTGGMKYRNITDPGAEEIAGALVSSRCCDQKISRRPSWVLRGSPKPRPGADPPLRVDVIWPKLPDENVVPGLA